jgi:hypothetical protein
MELFSRNLLVTFLGKNYFLGKEESRSPGRGGGLGGRGSITAPTSRKTSAVSQGHFGQFSITEA